MLTVTSATEPGGSKPNEDWTGASGGTYPLVVAVIDGVGSSGAGCTHGTPWYAARLGSALLIHAARSGGCLRDALAAAICEVRSLHTDCDLNDPASPAAAVALVRVDEERTDWVVLADTSVVLDTTNGGHTCSDHRVDQVATAQLAAVAREPIATAGHDAAMSALVTEQLQHRNQPGGYWVAQSSPDVAEHALTGHVPTRTLRSALLASDGAMRLVEWGVFNEASALVVAVNEGPGNLIRRTRAVELGDPSGRRFPRFKARDDATAALIAREEGTTP